MSDVPGVEVVADNLGRNQWGRGFFFIKEGNKLSLNTKRATIAMGCLTVLLAAIQLTYDSSPSETASGRLEFPSGAPTNPTAVHRFPVSPDSSAPVGNAGSVRAQREKKLTGPQVIGRPRNLGAIPPGAMLRAVLVSGASNGLVRAEVTERLSVNGESLIEEGAVLVGSGNSTEERLQIRFQQAVFKDGTFGSIEAYACDHEDKIVGLKGSKVGNKVLNIAGSIGLGFVGGLSEGLQETRGQQGVLVRAPTMSNALLNATATTALEQSRNLMGELKERIPVIEVASGTPICVLFGVGR